MAERFIYDESARAEFYTRLTSFHDECIDYLLMGGADDIGVDIEEIKMSTHPSVTKDFCCTVMGGMKSVKPFCTVQMVLDRKVQHECILTQLQDDGELNEPQIFMIQAVFHYPFPDTYSCQFWATKEFVDVDDVLDFWS